VPLHFVIGKDRKRKHEKFVLIMCCRGFSFSFEFDNYQAKLLRGIFLSFQNFLLVLLKKFVLSESFRNEQKISQIKVSQQKRFLLIIGENAQRQPNKN
jgi:hypothetical protein